MTFTGFLVGCNRNQQKKTKKKEKKQRMGVRHFSSKPKVVIIACLDLKTVMLSREVPGETVIPALGGRGHMLDMPCVDEASNERSVNCRHVES